MSLLSWTPAFSVGRADLDEQHRQLLDTLHRLAGAGGHRDQVCAALETFMEAVMDHFVTEESLLTQRNCPDIEAHRSQHNGHMTELMEVLAAHDEGQDVQARATDLLQGWLQVHLTQTHAAFAPFLAA
jgi:hemerythrin